MTDQQRPLLGESAGYGRKTWWPALRPMGRLFRCAGAPSRAPFARRFWPLSGRAVAGKSKVQNLQSLMMNRVQVGSVAISATALTLALPPRLP